MDDVAATADGIRFGRRVLSADAAPWRLVNASDEFLLILPLKLGQVRLDGERGFAYEGVVQPGTIRFVQPEEKGTLTVLEELDRAVFFLPGPLLRRQAEPAGFLIEDKTLPEVRPLIQSNYAVQRLVPILEMGAAMSSFRRQLLLQGIASTLMSLLLEQELHRPHRLPATFDQQQFDQILLFAKQRLNQHLDLAKWAGAVGLAPGEFARRFQKHTGVAPYAWVMDRRVERAKRLVAQGELTLVDIALECGFSSQSHFTEAFRRRVERRPDGGAS